MFRSHDHNREAFDGLCRRKPRKHKSWRVGELQLCNKEHLKSSSTVVVKSVYYEDVEGNWYKGAEESNVCLGSLNDSRTLRDHIFHPPVIYILEQTNIFWYGNTKRIAASRGKGQCQEENIPP